MKIIIAGAGEVGYHLAKLLRKESHSIVLIDKRASILSRADSELDLNFAGSVKEMMESDKDYSYSDVTRILTYYKIIQENIGSGNYEIAEFHNNEMVKLTQLPEFYNIRGTLFYLKQDTANAQKYLSLIHI